jgi:membrane-associated phospholipid phosphatase
MTSEHVVVALALLVVLAWVLMLAGAAVLWEAAHPGRLRAVLGWLAARPWLMRARHTRTAGFVLARLRPHGAYGLWFTIGLASAGLALTTFGAITADVLGREELALVDLPVTTVIAAGRQPWLTTLMQGVTMLGSLPVIAGLVAGTGVFLRLRTGSWRPLLLAAAVSVGAAALDALVKYAVARPRPPAVLAAAPVAGYAYPSGHTIQAAAYGCLAYLITRYSRRWRVSLAAWAVALVVAFLVGLSRVYLGVHWLTDVMGSWALAAGWLAFALTLTTAMSRVRPAASVPPPPRPPLPPPSDEPGPAGPPDPTDCGTSVRYGGCRVREPGCRRVSLAWLS